MDDAPLLSREVERQLHFNRLPEDVLGFVFDFSVSSLGEVAPLARVNKHFNACVKRPSVLGKLELITCFRLKQCLLDSGQEAASAKLAALLQQVRSSCPAIGSIDLGNSFRLRSSVWNSFDTVSYVKKEHVQLLATLQFPNLRSVSLARCDKLTEAEFTCLSSLTSLEKLDVSTTAISDKALEELSKSLTTLIQLDLKACGQLSAAGLICLSSLTSLQELNLSFTAINARGLAALSRSLTGLTNLDLEGCDSILGAGFACLSALTSLQELDVKSTDIDNEGLEGLSRLPALIKLDLTWCKCISAEGFACLSSLPSLQELQIQQTAIAFDLAQGLSKSLTKVTWDDDADDQDDI